MAKAIYGIAAALALAVTPAWAGDEKANEKTSRDSVANSERTSESKTRLASTTEAESATESGTGSVAEAGSDRAKTEPSDAEAAHAERWLVEREGYRDGGY